MAEIIYRVGSPIFPGHNADRIQEVPKHRDSKRREQANRERKRKRKREDKDASGQSLVDTHA